MNKFQDVGYVIVRKLTPVRKWRAMAKAMEPKCILKEASPLSPSKYKGLNVLHKLLHPRIEKITGLELLKTFNQFRIYKKGSVLDPHPDRPACEVGVSLNLGGTDWKIGIFDKNNVPHTHLLKAGDAIVYHGSLVHWRPGKLKRNELIQAFIFFVDANGENTWAENDIKYKK